MSNPNLPNRDNETGIRYGVIPFNDLFNCGEAFFDAAEDISHEEYIQEAKDKIKQAVWGVLEDFGVDKEDSDLAAESVFESQEDVINEHYQPDCPRLAYDDGEYKIDKLDETDLFVAKSPYFTFALECSPCAPGACYLRSGIKDGDVSYVPERTVIYVNKEKSLRSIEYLKCYCLGHEWFDDEEAPYAIYFVETGERVLP